MPTLTADDNNGMPWQEQIVEHFIREYSFLEDHGKHLFISLDKQKLEIDFLKNYESAYLGVNERINLPDRHKVIAMLTRAFLDASPFSSDHEKIKEIMGKGGKVLRVHGFPNEYFAVDICTAILTKYLRHVKKDDKFSFVYPNRVYVYTRREVDTDYKMELFLLYRHYLNRKRLGLAQFSIHQMAHVYFLLEMGCDIACCGNSEIYYDSPFAVKGVGNETA